VVLYAQPFHLQANTVSEAGSTKTHTKPDIITRAEHSVSRSNISPNALKVLYRLKDSGYQAHLVGGGVRDLLLGREPKDFDIATDATPEDVRRLFRNCRLIGRRFRLAHVMFGREIIEVATFRALQANKEGTDARHIDDEGRIVRDNVYGSIEEDAVRRDFTVNALYYNIADFSIIDYAGGVQDINAGLLRLLGDPVTREDPVRMLRAVRFATKLGFRIEKESEEPIKQLAPLLGDIPPARLFDEMLKLFMGGHALANYELFGRLFPFTEQSLTHEEQHFPLTLICRGMENTDARITQGKPVTPAFLFALFLWQPVLQHAGSQIIAEQAGIMALPKRFSLPMREIWMLQLRLERAGGRRSLRVLGHPRFRAAYDFLLLRGEAGEVSTELGEWWTDFQEKNPQQAVTSDNKPGQGKGRRRRRPRSRSGGNKS